MHRLLQWRVLLPAVVLIAGGMLVGGWFYSRSSSAARLVSSALEDRLGLPVRFDRLLVGFSESSVQQLRVWECDCGEDKQPWITAGDVDLGLSPIKAIFGTGPSRVTIRDAHVILRFDEKGDLLTKLPQQAGAGGGETPLVRIESGTLTIQQLGRPDRIFNGIDLTVRPADGEIALEGNMLDEVWGRWKAKGKLSAQEQTAKLQLSTESPQLVTPALLEQTPFVNPNAWKQVKLEGISTAKIDLDINLPTEKVNYRVVMNPTKTSIQVPIIDLHFDNASGQVIAEGTTLTLDGVRGESAGGTIYLDSKMDFGNKAYDDLRFSTKLQGLDVRRMPKTWRLPAELEGSLTGNLEFGVRIPQSGGVETNGQGTAVITQARLNGIETKPITLKLRPSAKGGFDFSENEPFVKVEPKVPTKETPVVAKQKEPAPLPKELIPAKEKEVVAKKDELPANKKPGMVSAILRVAARVVKPTNAPKEEKAYLHLNVNFKDVNVSELLKSAGVDLPMNMTGKVTVQLQLDVPTDSPDELKAYRLSGIVSSRSLNIEDLLLSDVRAKLNYKDGKMVVTDFVGKFPSPTPAQVGGNLLANGDFNVGGDYAFKAQVKLEKVALEHIEKLKNVLSLPFDLIGEATANATLEGTITPQQIKTSGQAIISKMKLSTFPIDDLTFHWESAGDLINIRDAHAKLFGGELNGNLSVPTKEAISGNGKITLKDIDLSEMSKHMPSDARLKVEGKAGGTVTLRVPAAGEGIPRQASAAIDITAPKLKFQGLPAEKIKGTANFAGGVLTYKLAGEALGGQIELEGQLPARKNPPAEKKQVPPPANKQDVESSVSRLRLRSVQLSRLWAFVDMQNTLGPLDADISADFPLNPDDMGRLVGTGRLRAERIRWKDKTVSVLGSGNIRLTPTEMRFEDIALPVGEGVVRALAVFDRTNIDRSSATITLSNVPSREVFFLFPNFAGQTDLFLDGRFTTSIGREWHGSGVLTAIRGRVYGIPVSDLRMPISWTASPSRGYAAIHVKDVVGTAARGRLSGHADINYFTDTAPKLTGNLRFSNLNAASIFRPAGRVVGDAPITGTFQFASNDLRDINNMSAKVQAVAGESRPLGLPILAATIPFLGLGRDISTPINEGELRASLDNGVWRIQRLSLSGSTLNYYAEGTIATSGRVNMFVMASTGRDRLSTSLLTQLTSFATRLTTAPFSGGLAGDLVGVLANFVVYMEVTGTVQRPNVRVQALRTISEDAARFFLLRFAIFPI
jgi:hypothetical protein